MLLQEALLPPSEMGQGHALIEKLSLSGAPGGRRFAVAVFASYMALTVMVGGLNYWIDPYAEFPADEFRPLVLDVVQEKVNLFENLSSPPATLVLGTSTIATMGTASLQQPGFNFAVLGASPRDFVVLLQYVLRQQDQPNQIIVGLDPFALRSMADQESQVDQSDAAEKIKGLPEAMGWQSLSKAFGGQTTRDSFKVLQYTYFSGYPSPGWAFEKDGAATRPPYDAVLATSPYDPEKAFARFGERAFARLYVGEREPDFQAQQALREILTLAEAADIQVALVIPPIHPWMIQHLHTNPTYASFHAAALDIALAACGEGVSVFDMTDVESFGGSREWFYDVYHPMPANAALMGSTISAGVGNLCTTPADQPKSVR